MVYGRLSEYVCELPEPSSVFQELTVIDGAYLEQFQQERCGSCNSSPDMVILAGQDCWVWFRPSKEIVEGYDVDSPLRVALARTGVLANKLIRLPEQFSSKAVVYAYLWFEWLCAPLPDGITTTTAAAADGQDMPAVVRLADFLGRRMVWD
jgi:hypothetical protein